MSDSVFHTLLEEATAHLNAPDRAAVLQDVEFILYRQQDVESEVKAKVGKQSACAVIYPLGGSRDETDGQPYELEFRIDIYVNKRLPHDKAPAHEICEAAVRRIDRWRSPNGIDGLLEERCHVRAFNFLPDPQHVVWQIIVVTTRGIRADN